MFWRFGYTNYGNAAIEQVLDSPDVKLEMLLDDEEILQEAKSHNKKLID